MFLEWYSIASFRNDSLDVEQKVGFLKQPCWPDLQKNEIKNVLHNLLPLKPIVKNVEGKTHSTYGLMSV